MADIFISYSSRDRPQATGLAEQLRSNGYSVWIDESGIDVATSWSKEIATALSTCQTVMLLLSSSSIASKNVAKELAVASELEKHIVPVELEPVKLAGDFLYHLSGLQRAQVSDIEGIVRTLTKIGIGATRPSAPAPGVHARSSEPTLLRLAVLPFDDLSPAKDNEWFADGMMDELINTLGLLHQLHVNPRTDVIYYKKNKPKLDEIAADLRCRYIVEGGEQKAGEKIRIRVSLSDALQHKQLRSEKYDGTFDDIFEFQERTATAIAEALRMKLSAAEARTVTKKHTDNAEAYELFLKGQEYFVRHTKGDYERTLRLNEEAVRLDPNFAASWAIISNICQVMHSYYAPGADWLARAEEATEKVRLLEGETAQYFWIASQNALARGDKLGALHLAERAVEVSPGYPLAYDALAFAHQALGNLNERILALEHFAQLRENSTSSHFNLLVALHELGDLERLQRRAEHAIPIFERHLRLNPDDDHSRVNLAVVLQFAGRVDEARALADTLSMVESLDGFALYNLACIYLVCNAPDRGMEMLERSVAKGLLDVALFRRDPTLDPLRSRDSFQALINKLDA